MVTVLAKKQLKYHLQVGYAQAHLFTVSVSIHQPQTKQRVSLPVWIPGSYLVREFAKNLSHLTAKQGKKRCAIEQLDKCTWEMACDENGEVLTLSWQIYAWDNSVRGAYLDEHRGFVNGTCVFLRVHGFEDVPVELQVVAPVATQQADWKLACALSAVKVNARGFGVYRADNYDALVDAPIEMGTFWQGHFEVAGVTHELIVTGAPPSFDGGRLLRDTQRICETEVAFWHGRKGKPPFTRYVFFLNAVGQGYGGLEHCASTALICNRRDLPMLGEPRSRPLRSDYKTLLGLISHEYFHAWNVKRMRPSELASYDYSRENYTQLLWFFEGFTSYYDDLMLLRAGLITTDEYLLLFSRNISAVYSMPGRHCQSVAQASFDAWIKYYRVDENTPNITVNYYTKGALVAFCLDAALRATGKATLDNLMRLLWQTSQGGPLQESDIAQALKQISGRSFARELRAWVHGTSELPIQTGLARLGVKMDRYHNLTPEQALGIKVVSDTSGIVVKSVLNGSVAQGAGVAAGDELIAVNGWRLKTLTDWDMFVKECADAELILARDGRLTTTKLQFSAYPSQLAGVTLSMLDGTQSATKNAWPIK